MDAFEFTVTHDLGIGVINLWRGASGRATRTTDAGSGERLYSESQ